MGKRVSGALEWISTNGPLPLQGAGSSWALQERWAASVVIARACPDLVGTSPVFATREGTGWGDRGRHAEQRHGRKDQDQGFIEKMAEEEPGPEAVWSSMTIMGFGVRDTWCVPPPNPTSITQVVEQVPCLPEPCFLCLLLRNTAYIRMCVLCWPRETHSQSWLLPPTTQQGIRLVL